MPMSHFLSPFLIFLSPHPLASFSTLNATAGTEQLSPWRWLFSVEHKPFLTPFRLNAFKMFLGPKESIIIVDSFFFFFPSFKMSPNFTFQSRTEIEQWSEVISLASLTYRPTTTTCCPADSSCASRALEGHSARVLMHRCSDDLLNFTLSLHLSTEWRSVV